MTEVTPRPMATPDLAGLLTKPSRRPTPTAVPAEPPAPATAPGRDEPREPHHTADTADTEEPAEFPAALASPSTTKPSVGTRNRRLKAIPASTPAAPASTPGRQYLRSMSIHLPRSLHHRLGERADADGTTRTALILIAVNRTHDSIGTALNPEPAGGGGDLFDIPQRAARKEPSVETTIRVTDQQLTAIDALAAEHHANRSRLISTALELYLA